jgi:hypothetical protein
MVLFLDKGLQAFQPVQQIRWTGFPQSPIAQFPERDYVPGTRLGEDGRGRLLEFLFIDRRQECRP